MERGEWEDDHGYPHAPLPTHERHWRHPSEIGASRWAVSEPPLVVGRGLSIATGTVGAALAVGLLWLMIPHDNRSGVSADASLSTLRGAETENGANGLLSTAPSLSSATSTGNEPTKTSAVSLPSTSAPPHDFSLPTMLLARNGNTTEVPATAVALTPGHLVMTTAEAVRDRQSLEVLLPSGDIVVGAVIMVDDASGIAVLSIPNEVEASVGDLASALGSSTGIIMTSPDPTPVSMSTDDNGVHVTYESDVETGEGVLVFDDEGHLLGMCTMKAEGIWLISVDVMLDVLDRAFNVAQPAWLGIQVSIDAEGRISVAAVMQDGPAAAGGVLEGDIIVSLDGAGVATLEEFGQALAAHSAGDSIELGVVHTATNWATTTSIMLAARPNSL